MSDRRHRGTALLAGLVLAVLCVTLAAGPGAVAAEHGNDTADTTSPTVASAAPVNATALNVTFADDHDVDEATVEASDFLLSAGNVTNISVNESGSNATVTVLFAEPLDTDKIHVIGTGSASVADTNGNSRDLAEKNVATVTGMDTVAPRVRGYEVSDGAGGPVHVRLAVTEPLDGAVLKTAGPDGTRNISLNRFRQTGPGLYEADLALSPDGQYYLAVTSLTDGYGNSRAVRRSEPAVVDTTPPRLSLGVVVGAGGNGTYTFTVDADEPVSNVTWRFGDGTTAAGTRVTHTFAPGSYMITVRAADRYGNRARSRLPLSVPEAGNATATGGDPSVSVTRTGDAAMARVRGARAGRPVVLGGNRSLLAADAVTLRSLTVTPTVNRSLSLAVEATDPATVTPPADNRSVAGLTVIHDVPATALGNVIFDLSVPKAALDGRQPTVYRRTDGRWRPLATTVTGEDEGATRMRAAAPGLSQFVVAVPTATEPAEAATEPADTAEPEPTAAVAVVDARLNTTELTVNGTAAVTATLENTGGADGSFTAGLVVDGAVVDRVRTTVPAGGQTTATLRFTPTTAGNITPVVNGTTAGTLRVAAAEPGETTDGSGGGPLGFLPLGLIGAVATYVGGVAAAALLALKGLALALGY